MGEEVRAQAFRIVNKFPYKTLRDALSDPERDNAEGIVVRFLVSGNRAKLKYPQYVALHRIVTGMNERAVWERMKSGDSLSDIQRDLPEEFWDWVFKAHAKILSEVATNLAETYREYYRVLSSLPGGHIGRPERKDFALAVKDSPYKGWLFMLLDGKDIYKAVLSTCKPEAGKSMTAASD